MTNKLLPLTALFVVFLASCSSRDAAPKFTPDPNAFAYALTKAIQVNLYTKSCQNIDDSLKPLANEALQYWQQTNGAQAAAADKEFTKLYADSTFTFNGEKISLAGVSLLSLEDKDISGRLDEKRQSLSSLLAQCKYQLNGIKAGKYDIQNDKNADNYLKSLAQGGSVSLDSIPSLAGNVRSYVAPGTSHYTVGKILKQSNCMQTDIITLEHNEVKESYAAECSNQKIVLVSCDLGQCEANYVK